MAQDNRIVLLISEDPDCKLAVEGALKDMVKQVSTAVDAAETVRKMTNQEFDCFLLRTQKPTLTNPSHGFQFTQTHKKLKKVPWIILGRDIEDPEIVVTHPHVKFVDDPKDGAAIAKMFQGIFFSPSASTSGKVDANFVNPLVGAVVHVLKSMAQIELTRGTPFVKKPGEGSAAVGDISGMIAMNSDRFLGSMAICFEKGLALKAYEQMLGEARGDLNDDVKDAISEMTNIIFGNAKRDLNAVGHTIAAALPTVITGPGHEIRHSLSGHCICVPFTSPYGKLMVECVVSMKNS